MHYPDDEREKQFRLNLPKREVRKSYQAMQERTQAASFDRDLLERLYFEALVALDAERGFPPKPWKASHPTRFERTWKKSNLSATVCHERFTDGYVRWIWRVFDNDLPQADLKDEFFEGRVAWGREYRAIDAIQVAVRAVHAYASEKRSKQAST